MIAYLGIYWKRRKFYLNLYLPTEDLVIFPYGWVSLMNYMGYSTYPVIRIPYQVACPRKISSYLSAFSSSFIPSPRRFVNPLKTKFITNWANPIGNRPRNVKIKNHVYQWHWTKHGWTVQLKEWNTSVVKFSKRNLLLFALIFY